MLSHRAVVRRTILLALPLFVTGCSKDRRIAQPGFAGDAGAAAVALYDANKDGAIAGPELDKIPALKAALAQIDTDNDKKITAAEIDARVQAWRESRMGEMPVRVHVTLDGEPLIGAEVTLDPEPFLGDSIPPASGTTAEGGVAAVTMAADRLADPRLHGVACGWYRIRVTHPTKALPPSCNTASVHGCEVAMNAHWLPQSEVKVALKSK